MLITAKMVYWLYARARLLTGIDPPACNYQVILDPYFEGSALVNSTFAACISAPVRWAM